MFAAPKKHSKQFNAHIEKLKAEQQEAYDKLFSHAIACDELVRLSGMSIMQLVALFRAGYTLTLSHNAKE